MFKQSSHVLMATVLSLLILFSGGLAEAYLSPDYGNPALAPGGATPFVIGPGVLPDYLTNPNWAFTPLLRKFVDPLPGLCIPAAGNSFCAGGKNIPVAVPDIVTYPGTDYYVIELRQYSEMMHSDLVNPTTLRGYVQTNSGTNTSGGCTDPSINPADPLNCTSANNTLTPAAQHFLGPVIVAQKDRAVRVLFKNKINPGVDGDLFLPVDTTIMGSGPYDINYDPVTKVGQALVSGMFSTNRATLHLHGGRSPWISDGTPHQWITPVGEDPVYPQGISVENVPDMPLPARDSGEQTFFWTNQQSSRMMFYHDHAWGITRLNVYAGEAAGYLIRDDVEQSLITNNIIPAAEIPLVLMDKTFVDAATIDATDPTWNWGTGATTATGVVTWVTVTNSGSGYNALTPPAVTIAEGPNTSASAIAVVSSVVSSVALAAPNFGGSGYVAPIIMIDDPTGSGATAEATINGSGVITGITVTSGGFGYTAPLVTIADMNKDHTPATTATATATVSAIVAAVAVTDGGSLYTNTIASPTVVTIAPPPGAGIQAEASATVTDIKAVKTGDLWWPHVYMPAQNPFDVSGVAPMGRWAYGPYFYPATNNLYQPIPNPYYSPLCDPADENTPGSLGGFCQAPEIPSTPNPSWGAEAFMDTPLVNGTAYPYVDLEPKPYRLRILNAAHDRFMNLSLYIADTAVNPNTDPLSSALCTSMGGCAVNTEIPWVEAAAPLPWAAAPGAPATWPVDGRPGGVPDWTKRGPDWIMIGNEGGFLPMPVVIAPHPVTWNVNPSMFNVGNINGGSLILGPAERADVIVDFSDPRYHGKTLILYNDGAAPWPALNPQYDFFTGNPDGTGSGSAPSTLPGFGPNIRTIMQINICTPGPGCVAGATYDLAKLQDAFDPTRSDQGQTGPGVFQQAQDPIIAAQGNMNPTGDPLLYEAFLGTQDYSAYSRAYGTEGAPKVFPSTFPNWGVSRINDSTIKFKTLTDTSGTLSPVQSYAMKRKSIHDEMGATFDDYGRMRAALGLERNFGGALQVNFIVQTYSSPVTEDLIPGGVQVWKITHNGVDTHPIHFHLFDVQVLNRVGWDGFIRLPDPTELGWKETVRISPLEDTIVAIKPVQPALPFGLPTSYRPLNPATPLGSTTELTQIDPVTGNPRVTTNEFKDFAWEYVWHCHILSHEENDMMRAMSLHVVETPPAAPSLLTATLAEGPLVNLGWIDNSPNEIGFVIERCIGVGCELTPANFAALPVNALANATSYTDNTVVDGLAYAYRIYSYNAAGNSLPAGPAIATIPTLPDAPTGLTAAAISPTQVDLGWTDNATNETGFRIYRAANGSAFALIQTVGAGVTTFSDIAALPGTAQDYQVFAFNGAGNSTASNTATVTTPIPPPSAAATLLAPSGTIFVTSTKFRWTAVPWATQYWLQSYDNTAGWIVDTTYAVGTGAGQVDCTTVPGECSITPAVTLNSAPNQWWRVQGQNLSGNGPWSSTATFTVYALPPPAATPIAPIGTTTSASPTFRWSSALSATSYWLQSYDNTAGWMVNNLYAVGTGAGQVDCTTVPGECSITPAVTLNNTPNQWWRVQGQNGYGSGPWSSTPTFTVISQVPGAPALVAPADLATVATANPMFQWSASTGIVQNYRLVVLNGATELLNALYTPAGLGCSSGGTCTVTPSTALTNASYTWHVRGENIAGPGSWSTTRAFTITLPLPPAAPTLLAPSGTTVSNPITFRWTHTGGTYYFMQAYDNTAGWMVNTLYVVGTGAGQADCTTVPGECSITPAVTFNAVPNQWWRVWGYNASGIGPWSSMASFSVN